MHKITPSAILLGLALFQAIDAQVVINVDADGENRPISPYLYGQNGSIASNAADAKSEAELQLLREAGIRFFRQNNGNNATKYNWRKKLTSHPDWYNNIYGCDWDYSAQLMQDEFPDVPGLYSFQLIGKAAKSSEYNFNDWEYNQSQWGEWCSLNVCGGGSLDANGKLIQAGDIDLYLEDWPADSTVAIYKHWRDDLKLDMKQFKYWNMDNEMEMWPWTHDDVIAKFNDTEFEAAMQRYFATAKAIRAIDPTVKLTGPVAGSEWTWFYPADVQPTYKGKKYCWLEYFIMRCAEEEKSSGIKMLDVLDIHFYPGDKSVTDVLQTHRVLWDEDFIYPLANGVKTVNGTWDETQKKEYIFVRCQKWIDQYFGIDRGITFAISEYDNTETFNPTVTALCYASFLGEGARHGMEYFTPWTWNSGMWETVHLFSRYAKNTNIAATSSNEGMVSAYSSVNTSKDSMTIILVNRSESANQKVSINVDNFKISDGDYETLRLSNLPSDRETFVSHAENALEAGSAKSTGNLIEMTLPALSITAVVLNNGTSSVDELTVQESISVSPNPSNGHFIITEANGVIDKIEIFNMTGQLVKEITANATAEIRIDASELSAGIYTAKIHSRQNAVAKQIIIR
ncbi:MAG: glycoside hydrolase family 44 protein [Paludibacteraceae bacterium]